MNHDIKHQLLSNLKDKNDSIDSFNQNLNNMVSNRYSCKSECKNLLDLKSDYKLNYSAYNIHNLILDKFAIKYENKYPKISKKNYDIKKPQALILYPMIDHLNENYLPNEYNCSMVNCLIEKDFEITYQYYDGNRELYRQLQKHRSRNRQIDALFITTDFNRDNSDIITCVPLNDSYTQDYDFVNGKHSRCKLGILDYERFFQIIHEVMHPGGIIVFNSDYIAEKKYGFIRTITYHFAYRLQRKGLKIYGIKQAVDYNKKFTCDLSFSQTIQVDKYTEKLYTYENVDSVHIRDRLDYSDLYSEDEIKNTELVDPEVKEVTEKVERLEKMLDDRMKQNQMEKNNQDQDEDDFGSGNVGFGGNGNIISYLQDHDELF
eukprot:Mrub_04403.p1 GENE.Mrub_04403~~Mrub_04403.p1  ORF type:complete len:400 (-),score=59.79 Mrub_04403:76-1200(-)